MAAGTILIVEDEDNIALALEHLLGREGYQLSRVADGALALDAVRELRPDLILLDVMLPNMSGYEICQQLRQDDDLAEVRILIMTARGTEIERRKGLAMGGDGFITKPFELSELRREVARLMTGAGGSEDV